MKGLIFFSAKDRGQSCGSRRSSPVRWHRTDSSPSRTASIFVALENSARRNVEFWGTGAMARSWEGSSLSRAAVGFPGRRNKTLQSGRLGATEIYPLPFPEAESPKSRCRQDHAPSAGSRGGSSCLSSALGTAVTLSLELPPPTVGHAPATCVRVPVSEKCQSLGQGPP